MKLYEVYNGWMGNASLRALVIAENEEQAAEVARKEDTVSKAGTVYEIVEIFSDLSVPQSTDMEDP